MLLSPARELAIDAPSQVIPVAAAPVPAIARVLPSLTDLAFLMPIIFVFVKLDGARKLLGDGDTGWHIRTGEWILANHQVPHTDIFSFSRPGAPWFAWEWLSDILFALLHRSGGMPAVILACLILICSASVLLFRLVRRKCGNGLVAIAVTLLATGGCAIHWLARPHLFTLLFFTVTMHIADRAAEGQPRLLAWLVPLVLLWTNLHGGFFVTFLVLACYIGSDLLNAALESEPQLRAGHLARTRPWLITFAACFAVTFINPYGWQLHQHVAEYVTDPYQLAHVQEFQSIDFHMPVALYIEPLMICALFVAMWDARNRRFAPVFASLGWLHLALYSQRNVPLFAMAAAPSVARGISGLIASARISPLAGWTAQASAWLSRSTAEFDETDRIPRLHLVSVAAFAVIGLLLLAPVPASAKFTSTYDPAVYPERALSFLRASDARHIFSEDEWGDYFIYRLYPDKQVFVDGRSDFYGAEFSQRYLDVMNVRFDWQKTLDGFGIDAIAVSPHFALTSALKISRDWRLVYDDGVAVIFRRNQSDPASFATSNGGISRGPATVNTNPQPKTQRREQQ